MYAQIQLVAVMLIIMVLIAAIYLTYLTLRSPFIYPYFNYYFDVTGKRKPDIENYIDKFLIEHGLLMIKNHQKKIEYWKLECLQKIEKCILKKYRTNQFKETIDDENAFRFYLIRKQTRYKQVHYVKSSYKVDQIINEYSCDYGHLFNRNKKLKSINYECTLNEYYSKNQRKLMTKELRKQIMVRDNYTCQICGKYMPDEVGLHIDHIISVSNGGKTIPSNLQVLCSKCNGKKSNR